jgi:flavin reductase (DIM6/NTAB) family NADH-FMN oxidoreductase RutF
MIVPPTDAMLEALAHVPAATFLITSACGEARDGRLIERVQQCGTLPAALLVAMEKGHPLSPLIRDSRTFSVSLLAPEERLLQRIFGPDRRIGEDPFLTFPHDRGRMGAPIVKRATAWFDCEVVRHLDMETNFELYVGTVLDAGLGDAPAHRLNAALAIAKPEPRRARPRTRTEAAPAAESPSERARGSKRAARAPR